MTKFVLIERGDGFKNTYTTRRVAAHAIAAGTVESFRPITLKEIKQLRASEYREDHYFRHVAEARMFDDFNDKVFTAVVVYFSGSEGGVRLDGAGAALGMLPLYACNIKGAKTWYPETACVSYAEGQTITVRLKVFNGSLFVVGLTQGALDTERWSRIDKTALAFRCDDDGKAVTGLFK